MNQNKWKEILKGKTSVAIGGHERPDGDCIGSCTGLYLYLKQNYENIEVDLYLEQIPETFQVIRGTEHIRHSIPEEKQYDLFICLDCGTKKDLDFPSHYSKMPEPLYVSTIISATLNLRMKIILCRMQVPLQSWYIVCWIRRRLKKQWRKHFIWGSFMIPVYFSIPAQVRIR